MDSDNIGDFDEILIEEAVSKFRVEPKAEIPVVDQPTTSQDDDYFELFDSISVNNDKLTSAYHKLEKMSHGNDERIQNLIGLSKVLVDHNGKLTELLVKMSDYYVSKIDGLTESIENLKSRK